MPGYHLSVFLHILAATIWIGGLIFFALVAVPLVRKSEFVSFAPKIVQWMGIRFRTISWIVLLTLLVTGVTNLLYRGFGWSDFFRASMWRGYFGQALAYKLAFFSAILLLSAIHDFVIGPRATETWRLTPEKSSRLRRAASWIGRMNLLLALAVLACAIMLVRGIPF